MKLERDRTEVDEMQATLPVARKREGAGPCFGPIRSSELTFLRHRSEPNRGGACGLGLKRVRSAWRGALLIGVVCNAFWSVSALVFAQEALIPPRVEVREPASRVAPFSQVRVPSRDDEEENESNNQMRVNPQFQIDESNFDAWVFGHSRNGPTARTRLETLLRLKLKEIERISQLTEAQKQKLLLASQGDMKRFFDAVEEKRRLFQTVRFDQRKFGEFYQKLQPLQQRFQQGLFGDDSIFNKAVRKTLDQDQNHRFDKLNQRRQAILHQAELARIISQLDSNLALTSSQRKQLTRLIVKETHPLRGTSSYYFYYILFQLSQLPEDKVKPMFETIQWKTLRPLLDQGKAYEQMLSKQGLIPEKPDEEVWLVPADDDNDNGEAAAKSTSPEEKRS